jgi:hypothetical protein
VRPSLAPLALAATLLFGTGCAQTFDATTLGVPATLASDAGQAPQGTAFSVDAKALWFGWGIVPVSQPSLQKTLAAQLVGGRSVANVRIRTRTSLLDGFFTVVTAGLLVPRSVHIEGVVVEAPAGQ